MLDDKIIDSIALMFMIGSIYFFIVLSVYAIYSNKP